MTDVPSPPSSTYLERLRSRQAQVDELARRHDRFANARLAVAVMAALVAWLALYAHSISPGWLLLPAGAFLALVVAHDRALQSRDRARRAADFYASGLARIEDRWEGLGPEGVAFSREDHPYAADLDLFGRGSLFQLMSAARLGSGDETLARWLLQPAGMGEVRGRQQAVEELRPRLDLRERLAMVGEEISDWLDTSQLAAWGQEPLQLVTTWPRIVAALLAISNVVTLVLAFVIDASAWFTASVLFSVAFTYWWRLPVARVLASVNAPAHHLHLLAEVLEVIEHEPAASPRLAAVRARLGTDGQPASQSIHQLRRLVDLLESRHNQFFAPVAALLLWGTQFAWAIEFWRRRHGGEIAGWVEAAGEFEALCSIAGYAYEHPADPFPDLVEGAPLFDAEALTHPLIPAVRAVANDVRLDSETRVLVVSGSNMSGKSTLLRTVGVAVVLALAGAPVRARRLRLSPLTVGTTLRVQDSLQAGRSRFFAEITRLRVIVDLTNGPVPVLFLLDELLAGTNSHDRRIGAASVVRGLVERGAIGIVTTHDLALAAVVSDLGVHASNVHFSDTFEGGEIRFDYRMRPGVVQTSNALELMKAIGLISPAS